MRRPLIAEERCTLEAIALEGAQTPALANLVAVAMVQVGMILGGYPTGRVHVVLDNEDPEDFVMRVTFTIPREELSG